MADRLKLLLNRGENAVLDIAESVCAATKTKAFAKIRIADVANIVGSGISGDLYRYALAAHFDVLVAKENKAFIAIEFDGTGHDARNDLKKAAICNHFAIPMVRVKEGHLEAKVFGDTAVAFFIWQLFCVDAFIEQCGNDPYEPYDPAWFVSIPGKDRRWPFEYAGRWRARLIRPFREAASQLGPRMRDFYANGLVQFGSIDATYNRGLEYRSICAQLVGDDRVVFGEANLNIEVHGLQGQRLDLFTEIASFVEGLAAERMYRQAMSFLQGNRKASSPEVVPDRVAEWKRDGFRLRRAFSAVNPTTTTVEVVNAERSQ